MVKDDWDERFEKWRRARAEQAKKNVEPVVAQISLPAREIHESVNSPRKKYSFPGFIGLWSTLGVIVILTLIFTLAEPPVDAKFKPLDVIVREVNGLPADVYFEGEKLFVVSGWESKLLYQGKEDRVFGNERYREIVFDDSGNVYTVVSSSQSVILEPVTRLVDEVTRIGWFTDLEKVSVVEDESWSEKSVRIELSGGRTVSDGTYTYTFYRGEPFFRLGFESDVLSTDEDKFAYGFVMKDFDVYFPDGKMYKNDNAVVTGEEAVDVVVRGSEGLRDASDSLKEKVSTIVDVTRKPVTRSGSTHEVKNARYELFYDEQTRRAFVVSADSAQVEFRNSFYWNVYWVYVPFISDSYPQLTIGVFDEVSSVTYDLEHSDWRIESETFNGLVSEFIEETRNHDD